MATIQNKTARDLLYSWHSGMSSPFYAAASSGLVQSFDALVTECASVDAIDKNRLLPWIEKMKKKNTKQVCVNGSFYTPLPWVSRSYFPKV